MFEEICNGKHVVGAIIPCPEDAEAAALATSSGFQSTNVVHTCFLACLSAWTRFNVSCFHGLQMLQLQPRQQHQAVETPAQRTARPGTALAV